MEITVVPTHNAMHIAEHLRHDYNHSPLQYEYLGLNQDGKGNFPEGEVYASIPNIEKLDKKDVVLLHSGLPYPNAGLEELRTALYSLKNPYKVKARKNYETLNIKPNSVSVFFSFFPYGRQDYPDVTGGVNKAEAILQELFQFYDVNKIFTIDAHFSNNEWVKNYPNYKDVSANPLLHEKMCKDGFENYIELGPDKSAMERHEVKASCNKKRINSKEVDTKIDPSLFNQVKGKNVLVRDDVISTGGTMKKAGEAYREMGANAVIAGVTHLALPEGYKKVVVTYDKTYITNSVNLPYGTHNKIDVTPLVYETLIKELY